MAYTANPGVYNLVNGKLYKMSDLVEKLGDDAVKSIKGEKLSGGIETKSSNKAPIYITIALISLLLFIKVNYKPRTKSII